MRIEGVVYVTEILKDHLPIRAVAIFHAMVDDFQGALRRPVDEILSHASEEGWQVFAVW